MLRTSLLVLMAMAAPASFAADTPTLPDGNWFLAFSPAPIAENRLAIFASTAKDGKLSFKSVDAGAQQWSIADAKVNDKIITLQVVGPVKLSFEGVIDPKSTKRVEGSLSDGSRTFLASLVSTKEDTLKGNEKDEKTLPEAIQEISKLQNAVNQPRLKARREKDADKRKELLEEAAAAAKTADEKVPPLLKKVADQESSNVFGYFATQDLLNIAAKAKLKPEDVKGYVKSAREFATARGPRFEQDAVIRIATTLAGQDGFGPIALGLTEEMLKKTEKAPAAVRITLLKAMAAAQEKAGLADAAKGTFEKIDALESVADAEYRKTAPPFQPEKFSGRKESKANKVAVMELFTGAQCPPCVAADVAFDALEKTYAHSELVLIQYHMHIPGPDPLTNPTSISRWDFYREKFERDVGGTPATLFNGKPKAGGGGGMGNAKKKYEDYRAVIDEILEQKSPFTITGTATLAGDELTAKINVASADKPDGDQMLRLLLVEEEVRYLGGNGVRLHHNLVRSHFNLKDGVKVKELKDGKQTSTLSLASVRKELGQYLDDFVKDRGPFPNTDRPLRLKNLKVIALVQDDLNGEISQAAIFDVTSGK